MPSALSAHLLAIFGRSGIDAGTAVMIGALFGPAQVMARLTEFVFGRNLHPLNLARFAVALLLALAWKFWLGRFEMAYSEHGSFLVGVDYVDLNVGIPLQWLVIGACIAAAALAMAVPQIPTK